MSAQFSRTPAPSRLPVTVTILAVLAAMNMALWPGEGGVLSSVGAAICFVAAVGLVAWCPGRVVVELLGIPGCGGAAPRTLLALALSLSLSPVLLDAVWRRTHRPWLILAVWWAVLLGLSLWGWSRGPRGAMQAERSPPLFEGRATRVAVAALGVWLAACLILSYWPARKDGCPVPATPHDYVKHHAVLSWLHSDGLPLGNRFCADAAREPYYYYHYFYLAPATVRLWSGGWAEPGLVFGVFAALGAIACVGLIYALTKRLAGGQGPALFAAAAASLIGGLDVIPLALQGTLVVTLDAWADQPFRLHNFYTNYAWCPQHVLGLVIVLTGVLLRSMCPRARWWPLIGALLCASLFGATVYLAVAVFLSLALCAALDIWGDGRSGSRPTPKLFAWLILLAITALLAAAQFNGYRTMSGRYERAITMDWPRNTAAGPGRMLPAGPWANLLDLPWWLLLEYGVRLIACVVVGREVYRRCWKDAGLRVLLVASVCGVILVAVFRSGVHAHDYGFKIGTFASMALSAMLCGALLEASAGPARWWNPFGWRLRAEWSLARRRLTAVVVIGATVVGLPVGLYEAPVTALRRFVLPGESFEAEKEGYRFLRDELPADAVVQTEPARPRATLVQLADRQWGVLDPADSDVGVFRPQDCRPVETALEDVRTAGRTEKARTAYELLRTHRITHVFVGVTERRRWANLDKFEVRRYFTPVFRDNAVAIYALTDHELAPASEDVPE